jgi:hypothetical protein
MFLSLHLVLLAACAVFFYRAADMEHGPALVWGGLSVLIYLLAWRVLGWGVLGCLLGQVALFAGITAIRMLRAARPDRPD